MPVGSRGEVVRRIGLFNRVLVNCGGDGVPGVDEQGKEVVLVGDADNEGFDVVRVIKRDGLDSWVNIAQGMQMNQMWSRG